MDLFLNELSLNRHNNLIGARKPFEQLASILKKNSDFSYGFQEIKVSASFFSHAFTDYYVFQKWLGDNEVDADLRTLIKSKITTTPIIEKMFSDNENKPNGFIFEGILKGSKTWGLGAASSKMFDSISISLSEEEKWNHHFIEIDINILQDKKIETFQEEIRHVATPEHFSKHSEWIELIKKREIQTGKLLWLKKKSIFPNLEFCDNVKKQVETFNNSHPEFIQIQKRLFELDGYASKRGLIFRSEDLPSKVSPESSTRLKEFSNQLIQTCPDGIQRIFSLHSRFTPGSGRIHFYPLENSNKILIGSIANQNEIK